VPFFLYTAILLANSGLDFFLRAVYYLFALLSTLKFDSKK